MATQLQKFERRLYRLQLLSAAFMVISVFLIMFLTSNVAGASLHEKMSNFALVFLAQWGRSASNTLLPILISLGVTALLFMVFYWTNRRLVRPLRPRKNLGKQNRREAKFALPVIIASISLNLLVGAAIVFHVGRFYYNISDYGWGYLIFSTIFIFIVWDTFYYWYHRMLHWLPLYRYVHSVHHMTLTPHLLSQLNLAPAEQLFKPVFIVSFMLVMPLHPIPLTILLLCATLKGFVGHTGREIYPTAFHTSPWLSWNTTVTHHEQHHAEKPCNFAFFFTWWDRWMGTEHPKYHEEFFAAKRNFAEQQHLVRPVAGGAIAG